MAATRSSPGRTVIGSPNATSTGRCRRRLGRGFLPAHRAPDRPDPLGAPQATGTSGAPVSRASAAGPRISERTAYDQEIPASGNTHDGLALAQQAAGGEVRRGGRLAVDRDVPHADHRASGGAVPDVVPCQEPRPAVALVGRQPDPQEVGVGDVVAGQHDGAGARQVLEAAVAEPDVERADDRAGGDTGRAVPALHVGGSEPLRRTAGARRGRSTGGRPTATRGRLGRGPRR